MNNQNKTRWLVAVKAPKEKSPRLKTQGYNRNEVFAFPTKKDASDFIADVSQFGVQ